MIHFVTTEDGQRLKELRLEALKDTPLAFAEHYAEAAQLPDDHWDQRVVRFCQPDRVLLVSDDEDGRWTGMIGAFTEAVWQTKPDELHPPVEAPWTMLYSVYVRPEHRASGVADELMAAALDWSKDHGGHVILQVLEDNQRAIRFYQRHGFQLTDARSPYPLDPDYSEVYMIRPT
ncbi:GNAT family N-acetyltransferase [Pseudonocardiaceae bacterium YIM PH 21723]|nr:GNAT family N-acetyltransferase [Pseudonocardiaceae bacterium YIM PH 21723]